MSTERKIKIKQQHKRKKQKKTKQNKTDIKPRAYN